MTRKSADEQLIELINTQNPCIEDVRKFINAGADINYRPTEQGHTPLILSAIKGHNVITHFLLFLGADPLMADYDGKIASDYLEKDTLYYKQVKDFELVFHALTNNVSGVKSVINDGALVDFHGPGGYTALMIAVEENLYDMTRYLLAQGADLERVQDDLLSVFDLTCDPLMLELLSEFSRIRKDVNSDCVTREIHKFFRSDKPKHSKNFITGDVMFDFSKLKMIPNSRQGFKNAPTDEQITELENYYGHKLPDNFREILIKYNDSSPTATVFPYIDQDTGISVEGRLVQFFYLDHNREMPTNIWFQINHFSQYLGQNSLPFAEGSGQQIYFFKWVNAQSQIWALSFLDGNNPESYFIMNSFDELLDALYVAE